MTVLEKHDISDKKAEKVGRSCSNSLGRFITSEMSLGDMKVIVLTEQLLMRKDKFKVSFLNLKFNICFVLCICLYMYFIQATEEVSKSLVAMKEILYGTNEKEPQTEAVAQLAQELYNSGLLSTLIADLQLIDFEVRLCVLSRGEA